MKTLIVYAHPGKKCFTRSVLDNLLTGLKETGHEIILSDLYAMNFRAEMSAEEYEREGNVRLDLPVPEDVAAEQKKLARADLVIFLYPLWWSDCPAILKGWFDRVYTVGYAYGYNEEGHADGVMKKIKKGLVICTAGHPEEFLEEIGIAASMRNIMLDDRLGPRFEEKQMIILGGMIYPEENRERNLKRAYEIGRDGFSKELLS